MSASTMTPRQRLELVQLACVAAWSNAEVNADERAAVRDLARHFGLTAAEQREVDRWLSEGAPDFDPYAIPHAHREADFRAVIEVVTSDGRLDPEESALLRVLRELLT